MAFPTSALIDSFDRANEGPPPTGWNSWWGGNLVVSSNQLACNSTGEGTAYWTTSMPGADVDAWVEVPTIGVSGSSFNVYARLDPAASGGAGQGYFAHFKFLSGSGDDLYIYRLDGGSVTPIDSDTTQNPSNGDAFGIRCQGSTIEGWVRLSGTWTQFASGTDSTYAGTGSNNKVAVYFEANGDTSQRLDNYHAGPIWEPGTDASEKLRVTRTGWW